jgi:hypothetical protein
MSYVEALFLILCTAVVSVIAATAAPETLAVAVQHFQCLITALGHAGNQELEIFVEVDIPLQGPVIRKLAWCVLEDFSDLDVRKHLAQPVNATLSTMSTHVAEHIDRERNVGRASDRDGLAVVDGFDLGEPLLKDNEIVGIITLGTETLQPA